MTASVSSVELRFFTATGGWACPAAAACVFVREAATAPAGLTKISPVSVTRGLVRRWPASGDTTTATTPMITAPERWPVAAAATWCGGPNCEYVGTTERASLIALGHRQDAIAVGQAAIVPRGVVEECRSSFESELDQAATPGSLTRGWSLTAA